MNYELTGTIKQIGETQTFPSGFSKREFVVNTADEKYPQAIKIEAVKEGCDRLDAYSIGDEITVGFNIRGNEYNGKFYVSLSAWKFDRQAVSRPAQGVRSPDFGKRETTQGGALPPPVVAVDPQDDCDDIPF